MFSVEGLCIGGGAGSRLACRGGGGSGYIAYGKASVTPGSTIQVTIGSGGEAENNGSYSSVGSFVFAAGGQISEKYEGGDGGSGGGACGPDWGSSSAGGGSGGSNGSFVPSLRGGSGQGTSIWLSAISSLNLTTVQITFGSDGGSINNTVPTSCPGGGGGGGIIINGSGPKASDGLAPGGMGGIGGYGYGAGAGGGGDYNDTYYGGSKGASGVCIIKWA